MKKLLTYSAALLFSLFLAVNANAQDGMTTEDHAKQDTETMKEELNISGDLLDQVYDLNLQFNEEWGAIFANGKPEDTTAAEASMADINKRKREAFAKILSDEQMVLYDKMLEDRNQNMAGAPPSN